MISKIKAFYSRLTPAQRARLWTLFLTVLGGIAATGDKIREVPLLPGWLLNAWPVVVSVDLAVLKLISIFTDPNAVPQAPPANPPTS